MLNKITAALGAAFLALVILVPAMPAAAGSDPVRIAIHVDENSKFKMNLALNNAENVIKYYKSKGQEVEIRIVAYGPGLHMFRSDTSPVKARIERMSLALDNITFAACGNTKAKMMKKSGKPVPIISEAKMVVSGVVELVELQRQGWAYIKP
jgi:intracellular sulfur oxidation DsrE/DsrF family protein